MKYAIRTIVVLMIVIHQFCIKICKSQSPVLHQETKLWENQNCAGNSIGLIASNGNAADLASTAFNFDNKARSVSGRGIWLFYEDPFFEGEMEFDFQPVEQCYNFLDIGGKISAVRIAGFDFNAYSNSIVLYQEDWFRGTAKFEPNILFDVGMNVGSIIITGNKAWTLYSQTNFQGNSICVGLENYNPSFICEVSMVFSDPVQSVKIGCHTTPPTVIRTNCNAGYE